MINDPNKLLEPEEKVVFLSDIANKGRSGQMPMLMLVAIVMALLAMFWKTAVRQPGNREAALQAVIDQTEAEERQMELKIQKERAEYLKKNPYKHKNP